MAFNLTQTLINSHVVGGNIKPGNELALRIDQALLQDVLGIYWTDPAEDRFNCEWMRDFGTDVLPYLETTYINSLDIHVDDRIYPRYGESFARLVNVKNQYDPENVFAIRCQYPAVA
jgi:hypothetical protein